MCFFCFASPVEVRQKIGHGGTLGLGKCYIHDTINTLISLYIPVVTFHKFRQLMAQQNEKTAIKNVLHYIVFNPRLQKLLVHVWYGGHVILGVWDKICHIPNCAIKLRPARGLSN